MGKPRVQQQELTKNPAPVTAESSDVRGAEQRKMEELARKKGRTSTYISNPAMRTGFAGLFNKTTGSV